MIDSFYNRALSRMTRRELRNIAWKLGAVPAIAQPIVSSRVCAASLSLLPVLARRRFRRSLAR